MTSAELKEILREDVLAGAEALLGAVLVRGELRARIVETEGYRAEDDPACHAFRSRTARNEVMFGEPGYAYVYFNYGVHWMLNVTAHEPGRAAAVLVRAAAPLDGLDVMRARREIGAEDPDSAIKNQKSKTKNQKLDRDLLSGPGKLAKAFDITRKDNGLNLLDPTSPLHLLPRTGSVRVVTGSRIGIAEGKGHDLPWRFMDADALESVSRPRPRGSR